MVVAINQPSPQRQFREPRTREESGIDKLLKALNIANAGMGIAVNYNAIGKHQADEAKLKAQTELLGEQKLTEAARRDGLPAKQAAEKVTRDLQTNKLKTDVASSALQLKNLQNSPPKHEGPLRQEYRRNPITASTIEGKRNIDQLTALLTGKSSPAKQHAGIFKYLKGLDEASTVREGEFNTVSSAQSTLAKLSVGLLNKTFEGEFLTDKQSSEFLEAAQIVWKEQLKAQEGVDQVYRDLAIRQKLDPQNVLVRANFDPTQQTATQELGPTPTKPVSGIDQASMKSISDALPGITEDNAAKLKAIMDRNRRLQDSKTSGGF